MPITLLGQLPTGGGSFSQGNLNEIQAALAAQDANNLLFAQTPVGSSQLDPTTIQYTTVNLTSAQIKALRTPGITLVPAQGAGTLIEFCGAIVKYTFLTGAYVNGAGGAPTLVIGIGTGGTGMIFYDDTVTQPGTGAAQLAAALKAASSQFVQIPGQSDPLIGAVTGVTNSPLLLINTAAATFELVTGAGSAIMKVAYRVHSGL